MAVGLFLPCFTSNSLVRQKYLKFKGGGHGVDSYVKSLSQDESPYFHLQVRWGTFEALKQRIIEKTQNQQFKMPRVMRNVYHLKFLLENSLVS